MGVADSKQVAPQEPSPPPGLPPRAGSEHGDSEKDATVAESVQRWIAALPIEAELKAAILAGRVDDVRRLLKAQGALQAKDMSTDGAVHYGKAYLHLAVLAGEERGLSVAKFLAREMAWLLKTHIGAPDFGNQCPGELLGSKLDWPTYEGGSPLHLAVQMQQYRMAELLLSFARQGAEVGLNQTSWYTAHHGGLVKVEPLVLAVARDDLRMARLLLDAGAELRESVVGIAMQGSPNFACAGHILAREKPWRVLPKESRSSMGAMGERWTLAKLVHELCIARPSRLLESLLSAHVAAGEGDCNLALLQHNGMTPLIALAYQHELQEEAAALAKAQLLVMQEADVGAKRLGKTAEEIAVEKGRNDLAAFLRGSVRSCKRMRS